jgi:hypothetical protein
MSETRPAAVQPTYTTSHIDFVEFEQGYELVVGLEVHGIEREPAERVPEARADCELVSKGLRHRFPVGVVTGECLDPVGRSLGSVA